MTIQNNDHLSLKTTVLKYRFESSASEQLSIFNIGHYFWIRGGRGIVLKKIELEKRNFVCIEEIHLSSENFEKFRSSVPQ
jgi:hypothetical protein